MYRKACASFSLFFYRGLRTRPMAACIIWCMAARQTGAWANALHWNGANNSFSSLLIYLIHFAIVNAGFH
jgi:hypothetical protein